MVNANFEAERLPEKNVGSQISWTVVGKAARVLELLVLPNCGKTSDEWWGEGGGGVHKSLSERKDPILTKLN